MNPCNHAILILVAIVVLFICITSYKRDVVHLILKASFICQFTIFIKFMRFPCLLLQSRLY